LKNKLYSGKVFELAGVYYEVLGLATVQMKSISMAALSFVEHGLF
jgi:hypothetical protein